MKYVTTAHGENENNCITFMLWAREVRKAFALPVHSMLGLQICEVNLIMIIVSVQSDIFLVECYIRLYLTHPFVTFL